MYTTKVLDDDTGFPLGSVYCLCQLAFPPQFVLWQVVYLERIEEQEDDTECYFIA